MIFGDDTSFPAQKEACAATDLAASGSTELIPSETDPAVMDSTGIEHCTRQIGSEKSRAVPSKMETHSSASKEGLAGVNPVEVLSVPSDTPTSMGLIDPMIEDSDHAVELGRTMAEIGSTVRDTVGVDESPVVTMIV